LFGGGTDSICRSRVQCQCVATAIRLSGTLRCRSVPMAPIPPVCRRPPCCSVGCHPSAAEPPPPVRLSCKSEAGDRLASRTLVPTDDGTTVNNVVGLSADVRSITSLGPVSSVAVCLQAGVLHGVAHLSLSSQSAFVK